MAEGTSCRAAIAGCLVLHKETYIQPARLVSGSDLIELLQVQPGPQMGELLGAIHEAQAVGDISTRDDALTFAREWLDTNR